jgi:hypothetical protein
VGAADLEEYRRSDIRTVQSTPLVSRSGRLLGMISTHWRKPHHPTERELQPLDMLARQVEFSDDAIVSKNLDGIITSWNKGAESPLVRFTPNGRARQMGI